MEIAEIGRKKSNQSVRHQQQHPGELRKQQHRDARLIEESEKMVEELQQQMSYTGRKYLEKQVCMLIDKECSFRTTEKYHSNTF